MVNHVVRTYRLSRQDTYVLCSVTVDLKISEIVDQPNRIVSADLPLAIFVHGAGGIAARRGTQCSIL